MRKEGGACCKNLNAPHHSRNTLPPPKVQQCGSVGLASWGLLLQAQQPHKNLFLFLKLQLVAHMCGDWTWGGFGRALSCWATAAAGYGMEACDVWSAAPQLADTATAAAFSKVDAEGCLLLLQRG